MTATMKLLKIALDNDPSLTAKYFEVLDAANDSSFDWQDELANDPGYEKWINELAITEGYRHARMPGE
jgi:hypothetical protein